MPPPHHHRRRRRLLILLLSLLFLLHSATPISLHFHEAPSFLNPHTCPPPTTHPTHIAMTLDLSTPYLRGSLAAVLSVLRHSHCPHNTFFHFLAAPNHHSILRQTISSTFPYLKFQLYPFNSHTVSNLISSSVRHALDQPLNYARIYLANLLPQNIKRVVYLDSDLIAVDDITTLFNTDLNGHVLGAPEYCHANFTSYITERFWKTPVFSSAFKNRTPCYFNTGVMVIDLVKWREQGLTKKLEYWMRVQRRHRIYDLGSLPPFLLVFAGNVGKVEQRWNQHGLGGDNVEGLCRDLHPGPVSLLHWSGKGKPWLRLDQKRACTLDYVWAPYDLYRKRDDHQNRAVYLDSL